MRWIRSWPKEPPAGKSYVVDGMERLYLENYDYSPLGEIHEDICLLEWDMAADRLTREHFQQTAELWRDDQPGTIVVAPYLLYEARPHPVWAHRLVDGLGRERWIQPRETQADYFSFGMIFLPWTLVQAFLQSPRETRGTPIGVDPERYEDYRMTDQTFSVWHHRQGLGPACVDWGAVPVHLNEGRWA